MTLINAEKLKNSYAWWEGNDRQLTRDEAKCYFDAMIDAQAVVDAVVDHGHWIYEGEIVTCSNCGGFWSAKDFTKFPYYYCPHCGARMDDGEQNESEPPLFRATKEAKRRIVNAFMGQKDGGENDRT